jgi:hypothetical protein
MAISTKTTRRFHNHSDGVLADALGRADTILKAAEAEVAALKDEFKFRGLKAASGDAYGMTCTEQLSGRLDSKAIRQFLGDAYPRFEVPVITNVVRVKPIVQPLAAFAA